MGNRHFYFKYTKSNKGFKELKKLHKIDEIEIPLPIYFGKWKVEDYYESKNLPWRHEPHRKSQIDLFFGLKEEKEYDCYFWIFLPDEVYAIKLLKPLEIKNWNDEIPSYLMHNGGIPKFYYGKVEKTFVKTDLPESFANINANQKYNRKTIVEFKGKEGETANHLILHSKDEKMRISAMERLSHLSPLQFETLIFLIFVQNNIYCSTYKGGAKEKYDLLIDNRKEVFPDFKDGIVNIQIKMKNDFEPPKSESSTVYIYLGKTDKSKNLFGIDWILSQIQNLEYVKTWLKRSLDFFDIAD